MKSSHPVSRATSLARILFIALVFAASVTTIASAKQPLKVFVLAGQSNMEGHAHVRVLNSLADDPRTAPVLATVKGEGDAFRSIPKVWISYLTGARGKNQTIAGPMTVGFGSQGSRSENKLGDKIGPELGFAHTMSTKLKEPVLIIKAAWGGQSLNLNFRPPSAGPYPKTDANAKRFDTLEKREQLEQATGARYRQMVEHVRDVLKDIKQVYPDYDASQGYELAGFAWFQGWNDMVDRSTYPNRDKPNGYAAYTECMADLIRDVRKDLNAPKMPFVIGVMGVGGPLDKASRYYAVHSGFRQAMAAPAEMDEFRGNVAAVQTAPFWDKKLDAIDTKRGELRAKANALRNKRKGHENADGKMTPAEIKQFMADFEAKVISKADLAYEKANKSNAGYHYLGSARTLTRIGQAFADALIEMQPKR